MPLENVLVFGMGEWDWLVCHANVCAVMYSIIFLMCMSCKYTCYCIIRAYLQCDESYACVSNEKQTD